MDMQNIVGLIQLAFQSFKIIQSLNLCVLKTRMFGEIIKPRINVETEKYSVLRASNGLPPNFIHSQDSAHMMKVVCKAYDKGISHFCNVHDSFGTLAADSQVLADTIRETFVELYDDTIVL